jgi:acyl-CoA thioester hydrolase
MQNTFDIEIYVRFCETDVAGHINNTSYFIYFEEARTKFFDLLQVKTNEDLSIILASAKCDFMKQGYANEILSLTTSVTKIGSKSYEMEHVVKRKETGEVLAVGISVAVCFNYKTQQSIVIPPELRSKLEEYLVLV